VALRAQAVARRPALRVADAEDDLDLVFMALADRTRRAIVHHLAEREHMVTELAAHFDISLAAVSKHIKVLENARVVSRRIVGRTHFLTLAPHELVRALDWISIYRNFWQQRLDALEASLRDKE
jgi:DNA-binding transcriptional ArsR family regulator